MKRPKVVIVMPAFNAERTIRDTYFEIPKYLRKNIILVDDGSSDKTVKVAKSLGIKVFEHTNNLGYGANQKTCYKEALKMNPDIVVMLHPDYQYDASLIEDLIYPIAKDKYDFMFGSRIRSKKGALLGGMPRTKYYVNRVVCFLENILLGVNFTEHFSGFRAYSRKLLEKVPFQSFSNDFVFDQEMTISALSHGFEVGEISIPTRYHQKASSIQFLKGTKFILEGFLTLAMLFLHNLGIIKDKRFPPAKNFMINKYNFLTLSAITLINLILYGILDNPIFEIILFIETIILYLSYIKDNFLAKRLLFILLLASILISLSNGFDKNLFKLTPLESDTLVSRHEHFALELGRLYKNRIGINYANSIRPVLVKFNRNLFSSLNFELFFNVRNIVSLFFIPFFLLGIYNLSRKINKFLVFYLLVIFITEGFLTPGGRYGYLLYVPFINLVIYLGYAKA